jgi:hypothetical protein
VCQVRFTGAALLGTVSGGVYTEGGSTVTGCIFAQNSVYATRQDLKGSFNAHQAALGGFNGVHRLINSTFVGNRVQMNASGDVVGGAVRYGNPTAASLIQNCRFTDNSAWGVGDLVRPRRKLAFLRTFDRR